MSGKKMYRGRSADLTLERTTTTSLLRCEVTSKNFSKAVVRNKIKRWCREVWRKSSFSKMDNVKITVRVKKGTPTHTSIAEDFSNATGMLE